VQWSAHRKVDIGVLCAALAPLVYVLFLKYSHNWEPLRVPILLVPGEYRSPEFTTDLTGRYIANFVADRMADRRREQCLMGVTASVLNCDRTSGLVEFDWQVVSAGSTVQGGAYSPLSVSGGKVTFAAFEATRGRRQNIVLRIKRDGRELNAAHPTLVVQAGPEYWEALPVYYGYSLLWAMIVGGLGILWFVVPILFRTVTR
jgi:hypothetical protein